MLSFEQELKLRNYSKKTISLYTYFVSKFEQFVDKPPFEEITEEDVKEFILSLKYSNKNTTNLAYAAVKTYINLIHKKQLKLSLKGPRELKKLPKTLSRIEVIKLLDSTNNIAHKLLLELMYSSGLRVSEACSLKYEDINFENSTIHIKSAKGNKDRVVILAKKLRSQLKSYLTLRGVDNGFIFPSGRNPLGHITTRSAQEILKTSAKKAGIKKRITPHMLRHSFGTHLLENGTDIRYIQRLLGHKNLETTAIYTQVADADIKDIVSPLDKLHLHI